MGVDDTGIHTNLEDHHQMLEEPADMRSDREVEEEGRPYERKWKLVRGLQEDEQRLQSVKVALRAYLRMHPEAWEQHAENIVLGMTLFAEYRGLGPSGVEIAEALDLILEEEVPDGVRTIKPVEVAASDHTSRIRSPISM
jgi:alkylation response protein AidB-like acyl-CoA dehydrogenase